MSASNRYLDQMSLFWKLNDSKQFTASEAQLFFYLLNVSCSMGVDVFERTDVKIAGDMGISVNTLKKARSGLIERRLIDVTLCVSGISKTVYRMNYQLDYQNSCQTDCQKLTATLTVEASDYQNDCQKLTVESSSAKEKNQKKNNTIQVNNKNDDFLPPTEVVGPKKSSSKPKKEPTLISKARYAFEAYFRETFEAEYYWTAKDAKNMKDLLKKISFARASKNMSTDDDSLVEGMKALLDSIGNNFVLDNFTVPIINSQYNAIVAQAKAAKNKSNGNNRSSNQSGAEQRMREGADIVARLLAEDDAKEAAGQS